jgi:hypothetical protein
MSSKHWLYRKSSIRWLWLAGAVILLATIVAEIFIPRKGHFPVESGFSFNAWYGFLTCVIMVVAAKLVGIWLKRRDDYYDD